ncbi:MAG: ATP-binding cassette domain-containing protein [Pseudomonadota bacterium]
MSVPPSANESSGLALDRVTIRIAGRALFPPLSLGVPPGVVAAVMGPSGCGKSSLLSYVCGTLEPPLFGEGRILLDGADVTALPPERRRIGILFQDDLLFPHMSVGENLAFGLAPSIRDRRERRARVEAALAAADLPGFLERAPSTLSGGQRARVALLRALLAEPRALLLDEPFAKLDASLKEGFRRFVFEHAKARNLPVLLVSHDREDAALATGSRVTLCR